MEVGFYLTKYIKSLYNNTKKGANRLLFFIVNIDTNFSLFNVHIGLLLHLAPQDLSVIIACLLEYIWILFYFYFIFDQYETEQYL